MDIERLATSAVEEAIAKTDFLSPFVNSGDKEPFWDGHIYAFSHKSKKNEFYKGRAPLQVKGKLRKKFSQKKFRYRVRVTDLRSYCKEGGTIYFVVQISNEGTCKRIYYNALLPYDINQILEGTEATEKVSVTMHEFPNDKNEIENIVFDFIRDRERQELLKNGKNISLDSLVQRIGPENVSYSFSYTGLGYDRNRPHEYLFNHDLYLYAESKELNYQIPISHICKAESIKTEWEQSIGANGKEYFKSCEVFQTLEYEEIYFGKSIVLKQPHGENPVLSFSLKGTLDERISAIEFLLAIFEDQAIMIGGTRIKMGFSAEEVKNFGIEELEKQLQDLKTVKEVLDSLDVQIPLECDNMTDADEKHIGTLLAGIKHKELIDFGNDKVPVIGHVSIANLKIMLHCIEFADGKYKIENFADCMENCKSEDTNGEFFETSKYTLLCANDFIEVSNLRLDKMEEELFAIENKGHFERVNLIMLEMIKAYDEKKNDGLIQSAIRIGIWLADKGDDSDIAVLNIYQCYYRTRRLTDEEMDALEDIAERRADKPAIMLGAYILLQNSRKVKRIFDEISSGEQEQFTQLPIYHIWEKRENEDIT